MLTTHDPGPKRQGCSALRRSNASPRLVHESGAVALGVACGDQPTEVGVDREAVKAAGMAQTPGMTADATASSDDGLMISTDKDDYQPGDTVHFTGSGWAANDVLDIVLTDDPLTHDPHRGP